MFYFIALMYSLQFTHFQHQLPKYKDLQRLLNSQYGMYHSCYQTNNFVFGYLEKEDGT